MRILILSQYYTPEPIPKPVELAQALNQRGHTVSVVTGLPHYPLGKLYPGFRLSLAKREMIDGIPVVRSFEFPYHGKRAVGRILNYVSFMVSAPLASLLARPCAVIYVRHPPLTIGVAAWLIARWRHVPFVYDVQDIWPESAVVSGILKEGWLVRMISRLERFVYRQANHLLVVTEGARDNLIGKGVEPAKISVMPHWVDESLFEQTDQEMGLALRAQYGWNEHFVVLFAGNIGLVQGLETVILAAGQLQANSQTLLVLVGDGSDKERLQTLTASAGLTDRVQFIERQPMDQIPAFMAAADALLVHLKQSELSDYVIPTKTLAYLAAGKPILMAMDGAAAKLIIAAEAGVIIPPENPDALAAAICNLSVTPLAERIAMGQRGRAYLKANLAKQKVIDQYEEIFQRIGHQPTS